MGKMVPVITCKNLKQAIYHYYCAISGEREFPVTWNNGVMQCAKQEVCSEFLKEIKFTEKEGR